MNSTYRLNGIEIFAAGTHNGDPYDVADIDAMIEAFSKLDFKPPLKAGHSEDKPGMPALGWVENLRRIGDKLVADFVDMPQIVYDYIKDKRYNTVSSEIYWNLKRGALQFSKALKAVSLLGAEIPAVHGLKPLHEMFAVDSGEVKNAAEMVLEFNMHDLMNRLAIQLNGTPSGNPTVTTKEQDMSDEAKKVAELQAQIDTAKAAEAAALKKAEDAEKLARETADNLTKLEAAVKQRGGIEAILKSLDTDSTTAKITELAATLDSMKATAEAEKKAREAAQRELETQRKRAADAEEELRRHSLGELAKRVKIPALRPMVQAFADLALKYPDTKVYSDEKRTEQVTPMAMVEQMVKVLNENAKTLFGVVSSHSVEDRTAEQDASLEVDRRTKKYQAEHPEFVNKYTEAMRIVLDADPHLKQAYAARTAAA